MSCDVQNAALGRVIGPVGGVFAPPFIHSITSEKGGASTGLRIAATDGGRGKHRPYTTTPSYDPASL